MPRWEREGVEIERERERELLYSKGDKDRGIRDT